MKLYRTVRTAFRALQRNVMRAFLTTLGIIIGVGAVITMMEIGKGSSAAIQSRIASMGANNLLVLPGTAASGGISWGAGSVMSLTPEDSEAIAAQCPAVRATAPVVRARAAQVVYGSRNWIPMQILGSTPTFLDVRDWNNMAEGQPFNERDVRNANRVCLIGQTLVKNLFENESPIDKEIRVQNVSLRVVGVLARKGANMMGMDQDDLVLAPWTTLKYRVSGASSANNANQSAGSSSTSSSVNTLSQLYPNAQLNLYPQQSATQLADTPIPVRFTNVDQIMVAARSNEDISLAMQQITDLLRERHRIHEGDVDDFNIRDMTEMQSMMTDVNSRITNMLLFVALISLVVGGVGIMNIMLVSVTERTHEIGLRMAVGARARDILGQFLIESILLCLAGGAIGILAGKGSSHLMTRYMNFPTETSLAAVIAAVAVSAGVGIIFGFYPAWKASRLDPIEALRYE